MAAAVAKKRMANVEAGAALDRARSRARTTRRRRTRKANPHQGPSVESFLREEGIFEGAAARAVKEVLVLQIEAAMAREGITKVEMARRMATSRAALDRLLDPGNGSVTLAALFRAASALGPELRVELRGVRFARPRRSARR
jgi:antitoxin HicB